MIQVRRIDQSCRNVLASRDTRDGVATDLLTELSPLVDNLVHNALMLALHALGSRTLATLAEVRDGVLWRRFRVDHDLVV